MARNDIFSLTYETGDVVEEVGDGGVLVHACNCIGAWGSGIALQLKKQFPGAFTVYESHCKKRSLDTLLNTCLLIPPQPKDDKDTTMSSTSQGHSAAIKSVWIACLFTSKGYGRKNVKRGNPGLSARREVVAATKDALDEMRRQLDVLRKGENEQANGLGEIASVKFNAGSFKVPWEETEALVKRSLAGYDGEWVVVSPRS